MAYGSVQWLALANTAMNTEEHKYRNNRLYFKIFWKIPDYNPFSRRPWETRVFVWNQ